MSYWLYLVIVIVIEILIALHKKGLSGETPGHPPQLILVLIQDTKVDFIFQHHKKMCTPRSLAQLLTLQIQVYRL